VPEREQHPVGGFARGERKIGVTGESPQYFTLLSPVKKSQREETDGLRPTEGPVAIEKRRAQRGAGSRGKKREALKRGEESLSQILSIRNGRGGGDREERTSEGKGRPV